MAVKHPDERWLIAIDIDGTLVHDNGYLSPAVVEQVQRVRALGHLVVVATGRSASNAFPVIKDVGIGAALHDAVDRVRRQAVCVDDVLVVLIDPGLTHLRDVE